MNQDQMNTVLQEGLLARAKMSEVHDAILARKGAVYAEQVGLAAEVLSIVIIAGLTEEKLQSSFRLLAGTYERVLRSLGAEDSFITDMLSLSTQATEGFVSAVNKAFDKGAS